MALNGPERPITNAGGVVLVDPGDAGELNTNASGNMGLSTGGAETRTVALPDHVGQHMYLYMVADSGDCVVTLTGGGAGGEATLTFDDVGEACHLVGVDIDANLAWAVVLSNTPPTVA